jgi:predicted dehydrogenase
MKPDQSAGRHGMTRREFVRTSAASLALAGISVNAAFPAGSDTIRVGLVGCGSRGTGAAFNAVEAAEGVELYAMGDLFQDHLDESLQRMREGAGDAPPMEKKKFKATGKRCFTGFDAYKRVLESGIDMVILAGPPHFRPMHLRAAVEAGKHVFMEKPVAVDPAGAKSIIESAELARKKGLAIVAGTQRRHHAPYREVMQRIHDGAIGDIVSAQCYWLGGPPWWEKGPRLFQEKEEKNWSELEYQIRNWFHYTWLSGDIIVEQHVHNLDVVNWAVGALPVKAIGTGGSQVRRGGGYGNIWDHFTVQFEYPDGVQVTSMCRQHRNCTGQVSERIMGTRGTAYIYGASGVIEGDTPYTYEGEPTNPYVQEHTDLIRSIRSGSPLNEGKRIAESTMTAILGRMCCYTGRAINYSWGFNQSTLDYTLPEYKFGVDVPEEPAAMPGITELI